MNCDDCTNYAPKDKSAHKRGERFTGPVCTLCPIPHGHHLVDAKEYRIPQKGEWFIDSADGTALCAIVTWASPRNILLLVPDKPLPLVRIDWWDKAAEKHTYQFRGDTDWPRLKRECFDEGGAEVVVVIPVEGKIVFESSSGQKTDSKGEWNLRLSPYRILGYEWESTILPGLYGYWERETSDSAIVAAIRDYNPPKPGPDWKTAARKSYEERWLPMCKATTCKEMDDILNTKVCGLCQEVIDVKPISIRCDECPLHPVDDGFGWGICSPLYQKYGQARSAYDFPAAHAAAVALASRLAEIAGLETTEHLDKPAEPPDWFREGWWVKSITERYCGRPVLYRVGVGITPNTKEPATLDDLAVPLGGISCWFVEGYGHISLMSLMNILDGPTLVYAFRFYREDLDERPIARDIAACKNMPVIPEAQWKYLQGKGEGK